VRINSFVDEATIEVKGGRGGNGRVAFYRNKKGVCGGNGGNGGDVYALGTSDLTHLKIFLEVYKFIGNKGQQGGQNKKKGLEGEDLYIKMPFGTTIIDKKTNKEFTLDKNQNKILLCKGGQGGLGNAAFKTSTNRTPKHARPGQEGQEKTFDLILRLIANFGLIGLPNAGKSSLLNKLTQANVKTANYPFTTLEPNLGVFNGKIIADVPGLIEGASKGKGLGLKFLKHIEKVELIFHCISVESETIIDDYKTVSNELNMYSKNFIKKPSIILLTKCDLFDEVKIKQKYNELSIFGKQIIPVSIYDEFLLQEFKKKLQ